MESLYRKLRPKTWEELVGVGNSENIQQLKKFVASEKRPHSYLFTGGSGCGKTTMARILANELGADDLSIMEINMAESRGIDTVREIIEKMRFLPVNGKPRVYILDECFHKDSLVSTPLGDRKISEIKKGSFVYSAAGVSRVKNVFENKVSLDRLVCVKLGDGREIFCSEDHLFFTTSGWIPAKKIKKDFTILTIFSNIKNNIVLQEVFNGKTQTKVGKNMCNLWKPVFYELSVDENLLRSLLNEIEQFQNTSCSYLHRMWKNVSHQRHQFAVLLQKLFSPKQNKAPRNTGEIIFPRKSTEAFNWTKTTFPNRERCDSKKEIFRADDNIKSISESRTYSKINGYQAEKGISTSMEGEEGRKWQIHNTTNSLIRKLKGFLGVRVCCGDFQDHSEYSKQLQGGYRKSSFKNCNRSRWERSSNNQDQSIRSEKDRSSSVVRVESVTLYKRRNNGKYFEGIISDRELKQGFVYFYDLEVSGHHSYFVENCLVHNCHKLTSDAQSALLKPLEDTPAHVYFLLCTTDPQKVLKTIKTRCTQINVDSPDERELFKYLNKVIKQEELPVEKAVIPQIIENCEGSLRQALVLLEQAAQVDGEEGQIKAIANTSSDNAEVIALSRELLKPNPSWGAISEILKSLKEQKIESESIRYAVLGYMSSVLLSKGSGKAATVMDCFLDNTYDSKFAGIVFMCYQACQ